MAKIKHSFLKNSLQLFCYRNVLNENTSNIYSKYDNCIVDSDDDNVFGIEEQRSRNNDNNKRKLTISTATVEAATVEKPNGKYSIVQTPLGAAKQDGKKMQNIYIHYTDSNRQMPLPPPPDVIQSSSKTIPPTPPSAAHSPKSPQSKHAKQELPDVVKINDIEVKRVKICVNKNNKKMSKMSRSKSTSNNRHVSKFEKSNNENSENFYNRARILSPLPALSAIQQQQSSATGESTKQNSIVTVLPKPIQLSTPTSASITIAKNARLQRPVPSSAPAVLTTTTTTTSKNNNNDNPELPSQRPRLPLNYNRQSYPPDMTLLNTMRNRSSYTLAPMKTTMQAMKVNNNINNINNNNNAIVYSNKNNMNRLSYTQPLSKPLTTTTSIPIKNEFSDFKQPLSRNVVRYPAHDSTTTVSPSSSSSSSNNYQAPLQNNINGVRLRQSRYSNSMNNDGNSKPKRSLSAISTTSTKKSVRFADSVGLELENIFNLSSFDLNKPTVQNSKNHLVFNNNNINNDKENSLYENHTLPTYYNQPQPPQRQNSNRFQINTTDYMNDTNEVYANTKANSMTNSNQLNKSNNNFVVKTLKLANLTIRTRINTNGKLESEV